MKISLCSVDDIAEGKAKGFELPQAKLFALKRKGKIFLYHNRCPHLGIQLEWQPNQFFDPDSNHIMCSSHGALFIKETGECIAGPCLGRDLMPIKFQIIANQLSVNKEDLPVMPSPA